MRLESGLLSALVVPLAVVSLEIEVNPDQLRSSDAIPSALMRAAGRAYELNMKGLDALEANDPASSEEYFQEALEELPGYSDAVNNLGVAHFRQGRVGQAEEYWRSIVKRDPEFFLSYYNLAVVAFHEKRYSEAEELLEDALKRNTKRAEAYVLQGRIALAREDRKAALRRFRKAHEVDGRNDAAWGFLAYLLIERGDTGDAVAVLKKHRDSPSALEMMGILAAAGGKVKEAADLLHKALKRGADPSVLIKLASAQTSAGDCRAALRTVGDYLSRVSGGSADGYLVGGVAAQECGDIDKAVELFEQGLERFPNDRLIGHNLGKVLFRAKRYERAEQVWNSSVGNVRDPELDYLRALNAYRQGKTTRARRRVERALTLDPKPRYYDLLGVILHRQGKTDEAVEYFRRALALDPRLRSAQINLSLAEGSAEDVGRLSQELEAELSDCKDECPETALRLAVVLYRGGSVERAVEVLRRVAPEQRSETIWRTLSLFQKKAHELEGGIRTLEQAGRQGKLGPETQRELAELYLLAGYYGKAIEALTSLDGSAIMEPWRLSYQLGYAYLEQGRLRKAREYFERSLKQSPDNVAAQSLTAFVCNELGDKERARELWTRSVRKDPKNPVLLINVGLAREAEGDYEGALENYLKAKELSQDDAGLQINIGNAYAGMGRIGEALAAYAQALNSEKRQTAAYNIFLLARKSGDDRKARKMTELLRREFPSSDNTRRAGAEMALVAKDTVRARELLSGIERLDSGDRLMLARIFAARGETDAAEEMIDAVPDEGEWNKKKLELRAQIAFNEADYEEAYRLWSEIGDDGFGGKYNRALAAMKTGRYSLAYRIASSIASDSTQEDVDDVRRLAANAALALKNWEEAETWYRGMLEAGETGDPLVHYNLAVVAYNRGNIEEAYGFYRRARDLDPSIHNRDIENRYAASTAPVVRDSQVVLDSLDALYNEAVALQGAGREEEAESTYRGIVEGHPRYARAWNNLGALYAGRGELEDAEECYLKAVGHASELPEAFANLVNLYLARDEPKKALNWLRKARRLHPDDPLLRRMASKVGGDESDGSAENRAGRSR